MHRSLQALTILVSVLSMTWSVGADDAPRAVRHPDGLGLYCGIQKSEAETIEFIRTCKEHGIKLLIPSLSCGGDVVWKTDKANYCVADREAFEAGYDGLTVLVKHARANGLRVYPSVAVCPGGKMLNDHPEWETRDREGNPSGKTTTAAVSLAYPEARAAKIAMMMDLVNGYEIDGVFLDYTRYPENSKKSEYRYGWYGYDPPLLEACRTIYGFDPRREPIDSPRWNLFNQMRAETVNLFVREFREAVAASGRKVVVAAFGDTDPEMEARSCGRDWSAWARLGLIEEFFLATYTEPVSEMEATVAVARKSLGKDVILWSALTPFNRFLKTNEEMEAAAKAQLAGGADGLWIYREDFLRELDLWKGAKSAAGLAAKHRDRH